MARRRSAQGKKFQRGKKKVSRALQKKNAALGNDDSELSATESESSASLVEEIPSPTMIRPLRSPPPGGAELVCLPCSPASSPEEQSPEAPPAASANRPSFSFENSHNGCRHGCPDPLPGGNWHLNALDDYLKLVHSRTDKNYSHVPLEFLLKYQTLLDHKILNLETMVQLLVFSGTEAILNGDIQGVPAYNACAIQAFEWVAAGRGSQNEADRESVALDGYRKSIELSRNLMNETDRFLIRLFAKRAPCSCLDDLKKQAKKMNKTKKCFNPGCKNEDELAPKMFCSGCDFAQYCSRKCQREAWPEHKQFCEMIANPHNVTNEEAIRLSKEFTNVCRATAAS